MSQSTISRRIQQARDTVGALVKERLKALPGITASEFESLLRLVESRFELSLARALPSDAVALGSRGAPPDTGRAYLGGVECFNRLENGSCLNTANLTNHETGLMNRTDDEIDRMIRDGVRPGATGDHPLYPVMPSYVFHNMCWKTAMVRDVAGQRKQQIVAVAAGEHVVLAHTQSGRALAKFPLQATAMAVAWHEAYQLFAATTMEGALWRGFLVQTSSNEVEWHCERVAGSFSPVSALAFSPTAALLAVAGDAGLAIVNMGNGTTSPLPLQGLFEIDVAFSRNGRHLAVASPEGRAVSVWRLPEALPISDLAAEEARSVHFGARERLLITASHDNAARVWESPFAQTLGRVMHMGRHVDRQCAGKLFS